MSIYFKGEKIAPVIGGIPQGTLTINSNGIHNISKYENVDVNIQSNLQEKKIEITNNGTITLTPEENIDGYNKIEIITSINGYNVKQVIDGDFCTLELNSLLNNDNNNGGNNTPEIEVIHDIPMLLEYQYSGTNMEFMGAYCYDFKSSLIVLNAQGNTKVMLNMYARWAGDIDMGEPEFIENCMFTCCDWDSVNRESGGYRIFFTDENYGTFNILFDPSNLTNVSVYLNDGITTNVISPLLTLNATYESLNNLSLRHHYKSAYSETLINSLQLSVDYINQTINAFYISNNEHQILGNIEYNENGQAYYTFDTTNNDVISSITYNVANENYKLFPQIISATLMYNSSEISKMMYGDIIYLQTNGSGEVVN